ncbi:MAG: nucleotidyltransferase [Desulfuromonadales bacterium]|nr:nucleotidyltransferase [Desulfuromonadales bacterium]
MRVVGLITEYNPFHNGHRHHLRESLRLAGAQASVAVMSGNFLQRGEPALLDKWARCEMALASGVDLVLELPFAFACSSAPHFALGAVQTLDALGVVDSLSFGSEAGEIEPLEQIANELFTHADEIEDATRQMLRQGINYPTARAAVLKQRLPQLNPSLVASPNNILGIEYLKALCALSSSIKPYTLPRIGADFHSVEAVGSIASATGIRQRLNQGEAVRELMPPAVHSVLERQQQAGQLLDIDKLFSQLLAHLLQASQTLREISQVEAGLEVRLTKAAMTVTSYQELVAAVKSRQWTATRIQRILSYVLMQAQAEEVRQFQAQGPLYLRLLGATERGQQILALSRKRRTLPFIHDPAKAKNVLGRFYRNQTELERVAQRMLAYDLRATRLHGLMLRTPLTGHRNRDFFMPPLVLP